RRRLARLLDHAVGEEVTGDLRDRALGQPGAAGELDAGDPVARADEVQHGAPGLGVGAPLEALCSRVHDTVPSDARSGPRRRLSAKLHRTVRPYGPSRPRAP